jgi:hypothetical protein
MEIERKTTSYLIYYSRGKDEQKTTVVGVKTDNELVQFIRTSFKGRFERPAKLSPKDGVSIKIKKLDHINHQVSTVMNTRIYNKSPRQARIELEKAIRIRN